MERIPLNSNDFVCDIGCGDGRIIHRWAVLVSESASSSNDGGDSQKESSNEETTSFLGIDIDPDRIEAAKRKTDLLRSDGKILPEIKITFLCRNAMESAELFRDATVIFLYLIPRGLKQIYPLIVGERHKLVSKEKRRNLRIVSYMSKLPALTPEGRALCRVEHQKEAAWPLYFYLIKGDGE